MSVYGGPEIVTSGLVLHLDAGNTKSYPGSGTTWLDLSGNSNNFTLFNGVTYNSGGFFTFNGTNHYAASTNNINLTTYDYVVLEVWFASNVTAPNAIVVEHTANWNTNTGAFGLAINTDGITDTVGVMHTNHRHSTSIVRNYLFSIGTSWNTQVNIFSKISDGTGRLTYCNGSLVSFNSIGGYPIDSTTGAGGSFANAIMYLASRGGTVGFYNGKLSVVKLYGIKSTAKDVSQNFNAYRSRYSL